MIKIMYRYSKRHWFMQLATDSFATPIILNVVTKNLRSYV